MGSHDLCSLHVLCPFALRTQKFLSVSILFFYDPSFLILTFTRDVALSRKLNLTNNLVPLSTWGLQTTEPYDKALETLVWSLLSVKMLLLFWKGHICLRIVSDIFMYLLKRIAFLPHSFNNCWCVPVVFKENNAVKNQRWSLLTSRSQIYHLIKVQLLIHLLPFLSPL